MSSMSSLQIRPAVDYPPVTINKYLKCKVCDRFSVPPVYNCRSGHVVCGLCYEQVNSCRVCKQTLIRNFLLDKIYDGEGIQIPCRNVGGGCNVRVAPMNMELHLENCDFISIRCCESSFNECHIGSVPPNQLFDHWKSHHKITRLQTHISHKMCTASQTQLGIFQEIGYRWRIGYFEYLGFTFFMHMIYDKGLIHIWVTSLASDKEATQFNYTIHVNLGSESENCASQMKWCFPVHSLQYYDTQKSKNNGQMAIFYGGLLKTAEELDPNSKAGKLVETVMERRSLINANDVKMVKWNVRVDITCNN